MAKTWQRPNFAHDNVLKSIMTPFLQWVAQDLRHKFGKDLSRVAVIFPNKRAELFLNDYLVDPDDPHPVWAPRYLTINQLFKQLSPLAPNDPIDSACRIFALYKEIVDKREGEYEFPDLDQFYGWAERILSDFDDVDKNMADADALFRNLSELKELENNDFLTEEQVHVLQHFFAHFDPTAKSELRERFRQLWDCMLPLYHRLNESLAQEGVAYEGALYRRVVEDLENERIALPTDTEAYAIVGFNVLDKVEQRLFEILKRQVQAHFYWDYDQYYVPEVSPSTPSEAGLFIRENLLRFGNELPADYFDHLSHIGQIEMVAASTEAAQTQSVGSWLQTHLTPDERRTAVVLCNEALLQPLLRALPENVKEVNVTKGFPLSQSEAATLLERKLSELERRATMTTADARQTAAVLHLLIETINKAAREFTQREDFSTERFEHVLRSEGYVLMAGLLNRLLLIAESGRLGIGITTLRRVLRQIVRQSTIPFQGEPAVGLQVMGVLETRCLDFDHIIMLSVNEGTLPQTVQDNSFIPYLLRRAFGLTTPERRTAVYAYYFYRLIQRVSRVRMLYNTSSEGMVKGEMSRFLTQLMVESKLPITHKVLTSRRNTFVQRPRPIEKPADLLDRLRKKTEGGNASTLPRLSPSAINTYLRCQLQFYYAYVLRYREPAPDRDDIRPNTLGTIFHDAAELIYTDFLRQYDGAVPSEVLKALSGQSARLHSYIRRAFEGVGVDYRLLEANVVEMYLRTLLADDARLEELKVIQVESNHYAPYVLPEGSATKMIEIGGKLDRMDSVRYGGQQRLRIVDYKTGGKTESADSVEQLFALRGSRQKHYMLQTFIYADVMEREGTPGNLPLAPTLYFVHHARQTGFSPYLLLNKKEVLDFRNDVPEFRTHLTTLVAEMLDSHRPFLPLEGEPATCETCKYYALCYQ